MCGQRGWLIAGGDCLTAYFFTIHLIILIMQPNLRLQIHLIKKLHSMWFVAIQIRKHIFENWCSWIENWFVKLITKPLGYSISQYN